MACACEHRARDTFAQHSSDGDEEAEKPVRYRQATIERDSSVQGGGSARYTKGSVGVSACDGVGPHVAERSAGRGLCTTSTCAQHSSEGEEAAKKTVRHREIDIGEGLKRPRRRQRCER